MPKRIFEDKHTEAVVENQAVQDQAVLEPAVKQMVRVISSITDETHDNVLSVDAELTEWLKKGYKLLTCQVTGTDMNGISIYYCLVRQ